MDWVVTDNYQIAALLGLPFAAAALCMILPGVVARIVGLLAGLVELGLGVRAWIALTSAPAAAGAMQFNLREQIPWLPSLGASFHVGLDGLSLPVVLLVTLVTPLAMLAAFRDERFGRDRSVYAWILVMEGGMLGAAVALDLLLFYLFWELMLIPAFFLLLRWGGPDRIEAAVRFVIFTMVGSLPMLGGIIYLMSVHQTASYLDLINIPFSEQAQSWLLMAFMLAFVIKAAIFPFHGWQPAAYVEAPTPLTLLMSAAMAKLGIYGMMRFTAPLFPDAFNRWSWLLALLASIGIVYGALVASAQRDLKRLLAYSSFSHMGWMALGVAAWNLQGLQGTAFNMVAHGLATGALFLLAGQLESRHPSRDLVELSGLARAAPLFAFLLCFGSLASVGLPGLSGFIGELLILLGAYGRFPAAAAAAAFGAIGAAVYLMGAYRRAAFGPTTASTSAFADLRLAEAGLVAPLLLLALLFGIWPTPLLRLSEPGAAAALAQAERAQAAAGSSTTGAAPAAPAPAPAAPGQP